jgi:hypothetical protein
LLFAKGKRPTHAAIKAAVAQIPAVKLSHDPVTDGTGADHAFWAELLRDGLTFDVCGLAPGPASAFPDFAHRVDLDDGLAPEHMEAIAVLPGPHLASSARSLPVVRGMLALACDLVRHFDELLAASWGPSQTAIGRRFFESVATAWLKGGPFPALGLTAFSATPDGAVESLGLAYWTGQELRIEPPLSHDRVAATRLGTRLVNRLVLSGLVTVDEHIIGPDGSRLVLRPSLDRAMISVWRE